MLEFTRQDFDLHFIKSLTSVIKNDPFPTAMFINKLLNHLDNQNMPLITAKEVLEEKDFLIETIPWYLTYQIKSKTATNNPTQSTRKQTPSGQSHAIPVPQTPATKLALVFKSM